MSKPISHFTEQVYIGMHIDEFKSLAGKRAEKTALFETYYVYLIEGDGFFESSFERKFYYFRNDNDKLFSVDSGVRPSENVKVKIE